MFTVGPNLSFSSFLSFLMNRHLLSTYFLPTMKQGPRDGRELDTVCRFVRHRLSLLRWFSHKEGFIFLLTFRDMESSQEMVLISLTQGKKYYWPLVGKDQKC